MLKAKDRTIRLLGTILGICLLSAMLGCESAPPRLGSTPTTTEAKSRTLQQLMTRLKGNHESFQSFSANCEALIRSPLLPSQAEQMRLKGTLQLVKPNKIRLVLRLTGRTAIRMVGDGKNYQVEMPIFDDSYGGEYGDPIYGSQERVHLMPDDLADALDMMSLFWGKPQMLKTYPRRWEIAPGSIRSPVIYPPVWSIDSFEIVEDPEIGARIKNSVMIDRRNEQVLRIDKFRKNGDLRVRIWHLKPGRVSASGEAAARLPGALLIWYPPPLEGTVINLRLRNRKINVPIPEDTFVVGQ